MCAAPLPPALLISKLTQVSEGKVVGQTESTIKTITAPLSIRSSQDFANRLLELNKQTTTHKTSESATAYGENTSGGFNGAYTQDKSETVTGSGTGKGHYTTFTEVLKKLFTGSGSKEHDEGKVSYTYRTTDKVNTTPVSKETVTTTDAHVDYNYTSIETRKVTVSGEETVIVPPVTPPVDPDTPDGPVEDETPDEVVTPETPELPPVQDATPDDVHLLGLVLAQAAAQVGHIGLDAVLFVAVQLLFALGQGLVHLVGQHLGLVVQLQPLLAAAVLGLVGRGIRHSALDLVFGQVRAAGDGDVLLPAGAQILGRHLDHAVDVDVKGDLDLRLGGETAPDAVELELAQALVVAGKVALALQHVDLHAGLHGACRGKDLALAGGDHAVAGDQRGGHAAQRLNGQGQRGDIHQHQTLCGGTGSTSQLAAALQHYPGRCG